jgi:hypothetical protein
MCYGISGWTVRGGKTYCDPDLFGHQEIATRHNLRDVGLDGCAKWEFVPPEGGVLTDFSTWHIRIDENAKPPAWWDASHEEAARNAALAAIGVIWNPRARMWSGILRLDVKIINLGKLASIGGNADFGSLTDASGLGKLASIGGEAYFGSLTDASGLGKLASIGGGAHFGSLTDADRAKLMKQVGK